MTYANSPRGRSAGSMAAVVILMIVAAVAIIVAVLYFTEPAKSLPSFLGTITHPASRASAHRTTRAEVALAVGVVCLIGAGVATWLGTRSAK
jgi:hypothetical protein